MVEKWLEREIARGLQGLVALRLAGAPADDSVTLTLDVWLAALDGLPVIWNEALDAERIRKAFRTLYRVCDRWPPPKLFLEHMGNRDPPPALPPPKISEEQRQRNLARLRELRQELAKGMKISNKQPHLQEQQNGNSNPANPARLPETGGRHAGTGVDGLGRRQATRPDHREADPGREDPTPGSRGVSRPGVL